MSLRWDLTEVEGREELTVGIEPVVTQAIVYLSMMTGLGHEWSLDEKFAPEFFARVKLYEQLEGPMAMDGNGSGRPITWDDVRRRIGMRVNVAPITRAAFIKNVVGRRLDATARECEAMTVAAR